VPSNTSTKTISSSDLKTPEARGAYQAAYKSGAAAERARWEAILGSPEASTNRAQAIYLAANTSMSAGDAISFLRLAAGDVSESRFAHLSSGSAAAQILRAGDIVRGRVN
jgi:hypothetical protein